VRLERGVEAAADVLRRRAVERDQRDRLVPRRDLLRERTRRVDDERRAVEHELVLAADAVDVDDRQAGLPCARLDLRAAKRLLPRVKGRAVGHDEHLRAGPGRRRRWLRKPDVFADDDADPHTVDVEYARRAARLEVPLLVEDRVVREILLPVDLAHAAVAHDGDRVVAAAAGTLRKADEHRAAPDLRRQRRELRAACVDERRPQQQVLRRIAAQRELRRDDQRRAAPLGLGDGVEDAARVGGEVADALVELRDRQLHRTILASATAHSAGGAASSLSRPRNHAKIGDPCAYPCPSSRRRCPSWRRRSSATTSRSPQSPPPRGMRSRAGSRSCPTRSCPHCTRPDVRRRAPAGRRAT